jgi:hypothetical protein
VLDEEVEQAGFVRFYLGQLFEDVIGDEVGPTGAGGEGEGFLEPVGISWSVNLFGTSCRNLNGSGFVAHA